MATRGTEQTTPSRPTVQSITDERMDRLGTYYLHFKIFDRYGINFERFVHLVDDGTWAEFVA